MRHHNPFWINLVESSKAFAPSACMHIESTRPRTAKGISVSKQTPYHVFKTKRSCRLVLILCYRSFWTDHVRWNTRAQTDSAAYFSLSGGTYEYRMSGSVAKITSLLEKVWFWRPTTKLHCTVQRRFRDKIDAHTSYSAWFICFMISKVSETYELWTTLGFSEQAIAKSFCFTTEHHDPSCCRYRITTKMSGIWLFLVCHCICAAI